MGAMEADRSFVRLTSDSKASLPYSSQVGLLNLKLRQQLSLRSADANLSLSELPSLDAVKVATLAVKEVLDNDVADRSILQKHFGQLFESFSKIYQQANIPAALRKRQFIAQYGLVISPDNNITSILDVLRVRAFMRGVNNAIKQLFVTRPQKGAVHIVYPACGPFAPLLLPLLIYYREQNLYAASDIRVTLIDMQHGAVMSLQALVDTLGLADYICDIRCEDAMNYQKERSIDIVLLEAMQHGFSREGQLSLSRYFASLLAPDGILIPQEVSIRAMLNIGQREFVDQWQSSEYCESAKMDAAVMGERTDLGEILSVTLQSLREFKVQILDEYTSLIECAHIVLPEALKQSDQQLLLLCSQIRVFGDECLGEYDSGITHPLPDEQVFIGFIPASPRPGDLLVKAKSVLKFYYRLNGLPGFFASCDQVK